MDNQLNLNKIDKLYNNLTYYDLYGSSIILVIFLTIILILACSYCYIMINIQPIKDDWNNQRCKPYIIPFAGFINRPNDIPFNDFTKQNFDYCTQNILKNITGDAVQPLTYVTQVLYILFNTIRESLNSIRQMFDKVRNLFNSVVQEIMGRLANIMIPLQQIIISFRDIMSKVLGIMTTGLFTLLASYYSLKALMGAIAQMVITILIALVAMIALFWIFPFTWGAAISFTATFIAISIPLAIMLAFMIDVLKVQPGLSIPTLKVHSVKCFDKDTKLFMNDGTERKIIDIKCGDVLSKGDIVTAYFKLERDGSQMYNLDGIVVSDSHLVKYKSNWIRVCQHPKAIKIENYDGEYLYCLNTTSKLIKLETSLGETIIFSDWDEIIDEDLYTLKLFHKYNSIFDPLLSEKTSKYENEFIHKYYDGGLSSDTQIRLFDNSFKNIKDIQVGDILYNNEKVYGIVQINGDDLIEQYSYNLGNSDMIQGSPNINFCDRNVIFTSTLKYNKKIALREKQSILYHLLTDKKTFHVGKYKLFDYNASIDLLLEKNRGKLLSMKYV